jgi:hypothetical protein
MHCARVPRPLSALRSDPDLRYHPSKYYRPALSRLQHRLDRRTDPDGHKQCWNRRHAKQRPALWKIRAEVSKAAGLGAMMKVKHGLRRADTPG